MCYNKVSKNILNKEEYDMSSKSGMKTVYFIGGLFTGAVVGGACALLFAPKSGEETRQIIANTVGEALEDIRDQASEYYQEVRSQFDDLTDSFTDQINAYRQEIEVKIDEIQAETNEEIQELNDELDEIKAETAAAKEVPAEDTTKDAPKDTPKPADAKAEKVSETK